MDLKDYRIDFVEKYRGVENHQRYTRKVYLEYARKFKMPLHTR